MRVGLSLIDHFIEDLKVQASRDLDGAKIILEQNGPIEHVAWFCEQSYEKTIKYVYAYYKLKIQNGKLEAVEEKMKAKSHFGSHELIINMIREIFLSFWQSLLPRFLEEQSVPPELKAFIPEKLKQSKIHGMGYFDRMFDHAIKQINSLLQNKENYNEWLLKSNEKNMREYLASFDYDKKISEMLVPIAKDIRSTIPKSLAEQVESFLLPPLYQKLMGFIMTMIALSVRVLPYIEISRYPVRECNYVNLQLFREHEGHLKPYFAYLETELREFHKSSEGFIESLKKLNQGAADEF